MLFEFDPAKSVGNKLKHGIDFDEAQALWLDPRGVVVPAKTMGEPRSLLVGQIAGKHWSAIFTFRSGKIRIISVRRSRTEEVDIYGRQDI